MDWETLLPLLGTGTVGGILTMLVQKFFSRRTDNVDATKQENNLYLSDIKYLRDRQDRLEGRIDALEEELKSWKSKYFKLSVIAAKMYSHLKTHSTSSAARILIHEYEQMASLSEDDILEGTHLQIPVEEIALVNAEEGEV